MENRLVVLINRVTQERVYKNLCEYRRTWSGTLSFLQQKLIHKATDSKPLL